MRDSMRGFDGGRSSRRRMHHYGGKPRFRKPDHEPLSTTEDIPELLKEQAEALLETGEEIKVSVSTDLRFDGTYGKDWLLITNRRLIAFNQDGVLGHDMREVPLSSIEDVEILEMYGNNILKVSTADNAFELSRYSKRLTPKFSRAVSELEGLVSQTEANSEDRPPGGHGRGRRGRGPGGMSSGAKGRCEKCGQPIPSWSDICVNCVQKGKLIFRLIKYAAPLWYVVVPAFLLMMVIRFVGVYPPILGKELVDAILKPVETAVSLGQPLPETTWGHLQGTVNFLSGWFDNIPAAGTFGHLIGLILLMVGVRVFTLLTSSVRGYMMAWAGQNITRRLQNETYEHLNALSIDFSMNEIPEI